MEMKVDTITWFSVAAGKSISEIALRAFVKQSLLV